VFKDTAEVSAKPHDIPSLKYQYTPLYNTAVALVAAVAPVKKSLARTYPPIAAVVAVLEVIDPTNKYADGFTLHKFLKVAAVVASLYDT